MSRLRNSGVNNTFFFGVSKDYHLLRKNETSQVTDLALFFCLGRCKRLGSLKSPPWYAPKLSRASGLFSPQPWIPSASTVRGSSWLGGRNTLWLLLWQVTFFVHKDVIMLRTSRWAHPGWAINPRKTSPDDFHKSSPPLSSWWEPLISGILWWR